MDNYLGVVWFPGNSWPPGLLKTSPMRRPLIAAAVAVSLLPASPALGAGPVPGRDYREGEVVVRSDAGTRVVRIKDGSSVLGKMAELAQRPGVKSASPNWIARAAYIPNDPGRHATPGGWQDVQWNFVNPLSGVNAPAAWDNLIAAGRPGGQDVVVAVVDTGVAYRNHKRFVRSPDLTGRLRRGYDFVDGDRFPLDANGHGTHVASTIAEAVDNGISLTGLAYGATIMPIRVLDRRGEGDSAAIASGIRYAAAHGAKVINLSFEFSDAVRPRAIPDILSALRYARRRRALVVGAAGNAHKGHLAYPARAAEVLSVGAITEHGCQADYSNGGASLDISAPGGGADADVPGDPNCLPDEPPGRDIFQLTFKGGVRSFGLPGGYEGTSMAAPHVSATAALVIASGALGAAPSPTALTKHLEATALDLGKPGPDSRYGAGKVDAAAATAPVAATP